MCRNDLSELRWRGGTSSRALQCTLVVMFLRRLPGWSDFLLTFVRGLRPVESSSPWTMPPTNTEGQGRSRASKGSSGTELRANNRNVTGLIRAETKGTIGRANASDEPLPLISVPRSVATTATATMMTTTATAVGRVVVVVALVAAVAARRRLLCRSRRRWLHP